MKLTMGLGVGIVIGVFVCGATLDWYLKRAAAGGRTKPEHRLPLLAVGGILIPMGLFIYRWTLNFHIHWIVPILSAALIGFGLQATNITTSSYIVDAFGIHAASSLAAATVFCNLTGALLPLAAPSIFVYLGYGRDISVLGFIALALLPGPLLLIKHGESLRIRSAFRPQF